jgi:hypothetical protein
MDDEEFLRRIEDCTYPVNDFHHREHVKVAYLYLRRYTPDAAMDRMRASLKRFAAAHNVPVDVLDRGYHETITRAWMQLVEFTMVESDPAQTADQFYEANPQLWQMKVLRFFYSRPKLMSFEAKANFIEPDITPLPSTNSCVNPSA